MRLGCGHRRHRHRHDAESCDDTAARTDDGSGSAKATRGIDGGQCDAGRVGHRAPRLFQAANDRLSRARSLAARPTRPASASATPAPSMRAKASLTAVAVTRRCAPAARRAGARGRARTGPAPPLPAARRAARGRAAPHRELVARALQVDRVDGPACARSSRISSRRSSSSLSGAIDASTDELAAELVAIGRAGGVVGQAAALAHLVHQRRAHAFAEHRRGHVGGRSSSAARRAAGSRAPGASGCCRPGAACAKPPARPAAPRGWPAPRGRAPKAASTSRTMASGSIGPAAADDEVGAGVLAPHVQATRSSRAEALDVARGADHRLRHRVQALAGLVEQLVGRGHRVVVVLGALLQQHLALALSSSSGKVACCTMSASMRTKRAARRRQAAHVVGGVVLVGVGVDLGAQALGVEVDAAARRAAPCP